MKTSTKVNGFIGHTITKKVKLTFTRSLGLELCDDHSPGEGFIPTTGLGWIRSIKDRAEFLKQYNGKKYAYAIFYEHNEEAHIHFKGKKNKVSMNHAILDEIVYVFSNPKSLHEKMPIIVTYGEFAALVDIEKWHKDVKKTFLKNKQGKALLYNNHDHLCSAKKFVMVR